MVAGVLNGFENVFFISRTNAGTAWVRRRSGEWIEAWGVRFVRSLGLMKCGMPVENVRFCTNKQGIHGKGL